MIKIKLYEWTGHSVRRRKRVVYRFSYKTIQMTSITYSEMKGSIGVNHFDYRFDCDRN